AKIFEGLNAHRDAIFLLFGIFCLISWLVFYLYALREYFCPVYFSHYKCMQKTKSSECYQK
ncbi:hypothetical protein V3C99_015037, partial [Haemonchus contortus]|uniref:Neuronatin n=1 Tax=Haemonchus contortus TaxID=6289 RepID=A0A7I4YUI0_HAECO